MAKLINRTTGEELVIGQQVTTGRGEVYTLKGFRIPHKPASTGRVYVKKEGAQYSDEFFPNVIDAEIVDHNCEGTQVF